MNNKPFRIIVKDEWRGFSQGAGSISFLNLASIGTIVSNESLRDNSIEFFCDGGLLCLYFSLISRRKIKRVSFDFTSIAHEVFRVAEDNSYTIYIVGATKSQVYEFQKKILKIYPELIITGFDSGFFESDEIIINNIFENSPDIVIAGLGAGKQEVFVNNLVKRGYEGTAFTCGGFIRQFSETKYPIYYPKFINFFKLRAFYRMYNEPHTIKRYFYSYPKNLIMISFKIIIKKIKIEYQ